MGGAVVVIVRKQRDIAEVFEGARALSPETARVPDELGIDESLVFRGLVRRAVLREAGAGRYYLDLPSWRAMQDGRRRRVMLVVGISLLALVVGIVLLAID